MCMFIRKSHPLRFLGEPETPGTLPSLDLMPTRQLHSAGLPFDPVNPLSIGPGVHIGIERDMLGWGQRKRLLCSTPPARPLSSPSLHRYTAPPSWAWLWEALLGSLGLTNGLVLGKSPGV